eukprot:NODE_4995_length_733_cov_64.782164_g4637_i0.p1 GENE.NODE_4995_length_733_cov_64.782164_g4637_i0~~NODE_4995_length_733_cov_64.782164_g4637_i0.p1  ORF type:complete len:133 (-),score=16.22 NODE_4995_length_733_cov_64.782164_g4637_i0:158-556(-)
MSSRVEVANEIAALQREMQQLLASTLHMNHLQRTQCEREKSFERYCAMLAAAESVFGIAAPPQDSAHSLLARILPDEVAVAVVTIDDGSQSFQVRNGSNERVSGLEDALHESVAANPEAGLASIFAVLGSKG